MMSIKVVATEEELQKKRGLVKLGSRVLFFECFAVGKNCHHPSPFLTCFASSSFLATIVFLCPNENGKKTKKVSKENCNNYTVENLFCKNFFASKFSPKLLCVGSRNSCANQV